MAHSLSSEHSAHGLIPGQLAARLSAVVFYCSATPRHSGEVNCSRPPSKLPAVTLRGMIAPAAAACGRGGGGGVPVQYSVYAEYDAVTPCTYRRSSRPMKQGITTNVSGQKPSPLQQRTVHM